MSGSQQVTVSQAQTFWIQWVEAAFPHLDSRAYFLPPVYFNRVPMNKGRVGDQDVIVLPPYKGQDGQFPTVQDSDRRDDLAVQRVLFCLQKWSEKTKEVLFGIIKLPYFGTPGYNGLAMPPVQGDFDVLLIHRHYGLVICEVKAFGDNLKDLSMKQQDIDKNIRKKLKEAMTQLDKAEAMLSHLVSDIAPGLRITKTIAVPNLTTCQVRQAVSEDSKLTQDLCRWLGIEDPAAIPGLCLCSDHLSDRWTPWNVNSHVVRELGDWWQRRVAGVGPDSHMTNEVFCGPATTVTVPSAFAPRLSVQTLGQAVWLTGEFYTALITLFPEQVDLLCHPPSRLFATGPPGTGKTVMLLMMGTEWLRLETQGPHCEHLAGQSCIVHHAVLPVAAVAQHAEHAGATRPASPPAV
ncbi:uncharacterized protein LOC112575256 isoform X2 [Pomacea canaliculata]|uniref:uncharacterized protein LOC112575256 isoform X2 n=1 Tax=Pomacea canaliculata TaxID=400727 RepID=UPI000D73CB08|nr:uncharacterized protein LOC112575256 isoform X2 [Pomacea canaliculata]